MIDSTNRRFLIGLHVGHNASAAIADRSGLLFAIQEERLNGEKNYWGFPKLAVLACMERVGAKPADLLEVVHGGHLAHCRYHSRDDVLYAFSRQGSVLGKLRQRVAMPLVTYLNPTRGQSELRHSLADAGLADVPYKAYEHHLSHAATAYFGLRRSPDEKYLVVTCDGAGDRSCATIRVMGGGENKLIADTHWGESLGAIYAWVTFGMGFVPLEHEYKLMGMAPYASDKGARDVAQVFRRHLGHGPGGLTFKRRTRQRMNDIYFGILEKELRGIRFDYVCAGLQLFTEEMLCEWIASAIRATGVPRVLAGGGVFMNVKANKRIGELPEVEFFEAFPSCGDETLSLGALYLAAADHFGAASVPPLRNFYLGDAPGDKDSQEALEKSGLPFERPENMAETVADLLVSGQPLARCAGPMEFGARALGNRSILADPKNQDVVRVINRMVKKRDFWMPFAPMVIERRQHDYLQNPKNLPSPYMMMTYDTKENFRDLIAAVHGADLTCRAQIVHPDHNPEIHQILEAFERRTGRGVVLNTSFNLHGYPIVRTAEEALFVFKNSGLEHMQVGNFLVHKTRA